MLFQSQVVCRVDRFSQPNLSERSDQHLHAPRKRLIHFQSCETDLKPTKTFMSYQGFMRESYEVSLEET